MKQNRSYEITAWLAVLLAVAGLAHLWDLGRISPGIDFYQFRTAARAIADGTTDLYDDATRQRLATDARQQARNSRSPRFQHAGERRRELELYSTPFLYTMFLPFGGDSYDGTYDLYRAVCLASTVLALLLLCRSLGYGWTVTWLVVAACSAWFEPLRSDVRVANVNQIQLLSLVVYLRVAASESRRLDVAAGAILGLAVVFKPNLVWIVPLLLLSWSVRRQWDKLTRQLGGMALGALAALAIGATAFGSPQAWLNWWHALRSLPASIIPLEIGNFAPARLVQETLGIDGAGVLVGWTLALIVGALIVVGRKPRGIAGDDERGLDWMHDTTLVAVGCLLYLVSAPLVWQHYLLLTLPAFLLLLSPRLARAGLGTGRRFQMAAAGAWCAVAINPWSLSLGIFELKHQAAVVGLGLAVLLALTLRTLYALGRG